MKVLIAAGGTGGHIYPGIAVAKEIMRRDQASEVLFVGTARGLETKIVPDNNFRLSLINSSGLKNVGLAGKIKGLLILPKSFLEARRVIKDYKPDVVIGAGGYVSGPVLFMASLQGIPTLVMDSNALPGFTNRKLAPFVTKAALTFEEALPFFGKKGIVTGNPVRKEFFEIAPKTRGEKVNLLIFGGSQGARAINEAMGEALNHLQSFKDRLQITHQTGEFDYEKIKEVYNRADLPFSDVRPYISDMVSEFAKSDLIICRAGATSCAELAAAGKASIMIPLPTAADDHQRKNAEALQTAKAARMILQRDLNGETLAKEIINLINSPFLISEMEAAAKKLARKDAAEVTVNLIEDLVRGK
ncbi:MAG: UDP-N-acetylglucosamine--N-acetylmuramyl-(pentapeptide) pyrophosphoryl-undecaprenol [Acidobacteria bacterium]|jgi:UDP-N-acetylglucosamine--N-acetylmuramyl-(pentapeptide) pyrophosphoryl-undecaprenol N-acetylglucosamine transferase|nr:UDP-N-acetylglucosamine--N-acetylmuramyl-(pentapeptide) pyrophosphoryl-undecaprenol [Acidobacteriota bacterium]